MPGTTLVIGRNANAWDGCLLYFFVGTNHGTNYSLNEYKSAWVDEINYSRNSFATDAVHYILKRDCLGVENSFPSETMAVYS